MRLLRGLAVFLVGLVGTIILLDFYISQTMLDEVGRTLVEWVTILAALALVLGLINLLRVHGARVAAGRSGWPYSLALLGAVIVTLVIGLGPGSGGANDPALNWIFTYIYAPLNAGVFSLLAFFVASAAYRALRLRSAEGAGLLIAGVIVLLGQIPLGGQLSPALPDARDWLLGVVGAAGARGIIIAAALGAVLTGLRVLFGIDRHYLDKDQ